MNGLFQKLKKKIKRKLLMNKIHCTLNDDKLIKYVEKYDYSDIKTLQVAYECKKPTEVILKMIDVAGHQLVMERYKYRGRTALHYACRYKAPTEVIMKMIELGGRKLVMDKTGYGYTALHIACQFQASTEVIMKLIDVGGRQLVMEKHRFGCTALHHACRCNETATIVIILLLLVGGKDLVQEKNIYGHTALNYLSTSRDQGVMMMVLENLSGTTSDEETKEIVQAAIGSMTLVQKRSVIHLAAKYGLKWSITKEFVASNSNEAVNGYDNLTGLRLFMIAAIGKDAFTDLSSIYGLMRMSPVFS